MKVVVIGGGLAGCEAAWQLAERGISVQLYEMKKKRKTEAQALDTLGELVCSNSFRGRDKTQGVGLLKQEMSMLGSLFMEAAFATEVPAGGALAVDRLKFSTYITKRVEGHPNIEVLYDECLEINPLEPVILASGPLTDGPLLESINKLVGEEYCYFYDGSAPIVAGDSIDYTKVFYASRYGKGESTDYLNAPMTEVEYGEFYQKLIHSRRNIPHIEGEKEKYFDGCMPIEVMASRGEKTLLFGPMKPVGLSRNGEGHFAVVQLRAENKERSMYNLVGFQTGLAFPEQKALIQGIPGLEHAEVLRYGVIHRNRYLNSPKLLTEHGNLRAHPKVYIAGQFSGVEGYVESAASGLVCGIEMFRALKGLSPLTLPKVTMLASLMRYISEDKGNRRLEPMNANFGLLPPLEEKIRDKKEKKILLADRGLLAMLEFKEEV